MTAEKKPISKSKMLRQKKLKEATILHSLEKNIPMEENRILYQPVAITMLKGDMSPMQVNMMVELMDHFQDIMREQLKCKANNKQYTMFDDQVLPLVTIPFKALGIRPDNYAELHVAAEKLATLKFETEGTNKDGVYMKNYVPLFSRISVPMIKVEDNGLPVEQKYNYKNNRRRKGYVEIALNPEIASEALRIGNSFTKFIKNVTRNNKSAYTSRMYMFISTFCNLGEWRVDYSEFHKLLGFTIAKMEGGEYVEEVIHYPSFYDVKRRVLEPPMKELKKMAEQNQVNCYYEYEAIYPAGKKRGNPDKLVFKIYKTNLGKQMDEKNAATKKLMDTKDFLIKELRINKGDANRLIGLVDPSNLESFRAKMLEIKAYVNDPSHGVRNVTVYALTSLQNWIGEQTVRMEFNVENGEAESLHENETTSQSVSFEYHVTEEQNAKWDEAINYIREKVTQRDYETWFKYMKLQNVQEDEITVYVPNRVFLEILEHQFKEPYFEMLDKYYKDIKISYTFGG